MSFSQIEENSSWFSFMEELMPIPHSMFTVEKEKKPLRKANLQEDSDNDLEKSDESDSDDDEQVFLPRKVRDKVLFDPEMRDLKKSTLRKKLLEEFENESENKQKIARYRKGKDQSEEEKEEKEHEKPRPVLKNKGKHSKGSRDSRENGPIENGSKKKDSQIKVDNRINSKKRKRINKWVEKNQRKITR